ncbi:hypothetical protein OY671_009905, partial [Metschnikowia pulcherrima]
IPGNESAIGRVQNASVARGVRIVTDRQSMIHVSGHPGRPESVALYDWSRPEILVPVHGEIRHMAEQARSGSDEGIPKAILQKNGDSSRSAPDGPVKSTEVRAGRLVSDGDIIAPADGEAMAARRKSGSNGSVSVASAVTPEGRSASSVDIGSIGSPLDEDMDQFVQEAQADAAQA